MPSPLIFDNFRSGLAAGTISWTSNTIRSAVFDSQTWTPDAGDQFVADAISAGAVEAASTGSRQDLTTKAITLDVTTHKEWFEADPISYPGVGSGTAFDCLVIFKFITNDAASLLLMVYGLGAQTGDGTNLDLEPEAGLIYAKL